ncbi:hypothetical protein PMIN01_00526 [Paraphaeosphaeria minitans]|uniref:Uncharacterized protein n=1 Tax=Paraphaeosphaeria minitans TaxID=565426 RepID=A0A9P6GSC1_9PLEO|nr:hypothetical protein PMIN01_00526 [Paraphaeosphaeria minitans]
MPRGGFVVDKVGSDKQAWKHEYRPLVPLERRTRRVGARLSTRSDTAQDSHWDRSHVKDLLVSGRKVGAGLPNDADEVLLRGSSHPQLRRVYEQQHSRGLLRSEEWHGLLHFSWRGTDRGGLVTTGNRAIVTRKPRCIFKVGASGAYALQGGPERTPAQKATSVTNVLFEKTIGGEVISKTQALERWSHQDSSKSVRLATCSEILLLRTMIAFRGYPGDGTLRNASPVNIDITTFEPASLRVTGYGGRDREAANLFRGGRL